MFGKVGRRKPESVTSLRSPPLSASLSIDVHLQRENPGGYCLWRHAWSDLTPRVASSKGGDGAVGWQRGLPGFSRGAALGKTPHHSGILLCGSLSHQHPSPPPHQPSRGEVTTPSPFYLLLVELPSRGPCFAECNQSQGSLRQTVICRLRGRGRHRDGQSGGHTRDTPGVTALLPALPKPWFRG